MERFCRCVGRYVEDTGGKILYTKKKPRAYISWQSDQLRRVTDNRVHRESTPRVHRHSGRGYRQESAVHIEWNTESLRIGWEGTRWGSKKTPLPFHLYNS